MVPFELVSKPIAGCFEIKPGIFADHRGKFVKLFHTGFFNSVGLIDHFEEEYYSVSSKGILRGLHFQKPPHAHVKIVTSLSGKILDIVVDLRKNSKTFRQFCITELDSTSGNMVYVPEGLAHGFYVVSDHNVFLSLNSRKFSPACDDGIRWDSVGFDWPDKYPIISEKDNNLIALNDFISPF